MSLSGKTNSSSQPVSTTTQNSAPWSGQQPYLQTGFEEAKKNLQSDTPSYFPNSTVIPFSNQTESALQAQEARATNGSPLNMGAQNQALKTLNGDYLNGGNPAYDSMVQRATDPLLRNFSQITVPGIDAKFQAANRGGSNIARATAYGNAFNDLGTQIGNVTAPLAYQNYNDERSRQMTAAGQAPTLANTDYTDIAQLGQVGAAREGMAGQQLQDQINRFNFDQNLPDAKLRQYMTLIGGGQYGGNSTATSPLQAANPWLTGAGLAGTLAGAAGSLFGSGGVFPNTFGG